MGELDSITEELMALLLQGVDSPGPVRRELHDRLKQRHGYGRKKYSAVSIHARLSPRRILEEMRDELLDCAYYAMALGCEEAAHHHVMEALGAQYKLDESYPAVPIASLDCSPIDP